MSVLLPTLVSTPLAQVNTDWLAVGLSDCADFPAEIKSLDETLGGALTTLRERGDLTGKPGELTLLPVVPGIAAARLLIVGLGPVAKLTLPRWEQAMLTAVRKATSVKNSSICLAVSSVVAEKFGTDAATSTAVYASIVGSSSQGLYKSEPDRFPLREALIQTGDAGASAAALDRGKILAESVNLTRELVNRHPEEIYPVTFASRAAEVAEAVGLQSEIFDLPRLQQERMGALLGVARGSTHEPRVVVLKYNGGGADAPLLALCGKGVTFDSGGLSIKPSDSMITMKCDMSGAATVLGAMSAIARLGLPINVIGVVGLVENMLGPHAYKMGEVLTARNGTTIEVHNTDAEGRIVLSDVLSYTVDQKPDYMVDLATLTGACVVALGMDIVGAFTNDQKLCNELLTAAKSAGEEFWQMPMNDNFSEQLKCDFADIKNVGTRWGGAITAAKFLERFVGTVPWVHLDIAGPAFAETAKPYRDVGGTGVALRTLVQLAESLPATK